MEGVPLSRVPLNLHPTHGEHFRWLARHGPPACIGEWLVQWWLAAVARAPVYFSLVVVLTVAVQFWTGG